MSNFNSLLGAPLGPHLLKEVINLIIINFFKINYFLIIQSKTKLNFYKISNKDLLFWNFLLKFFINFNFRMAWSSVRNFERGLVTQLSGK